MLKKQALNDLAKPSIEYIHLFKVDCCRSRDTSSFS